VSVIQEGIVTTIKADIMKAENRHEPLIKLCLSVVVVMIAVIMATGISFAANSGKNIKPADKKEIKIEKR
jgi:hypothetical protein